MGVDELIEKVNWEKNGGVVPVVVQDTEGEVLTLAYMDREALKRTLETGYAHYYSRSQKRIRMKGEISGNVQIVKEVRIDCDDDSLLLIVNQRGRRATPATTPASTESSANPRGFYQWTTR